MGFLVLALFKFISVFLWNLETPREACTVMLLEDNVLVAMVYLHGLCKVVVVFRLHLDPDLAVLVDLARWEDAGAGKVQIADELLTYKSLAVLRYFSEQARLRRLSF